ncbi:hypothetical protein KKB10_05485 [Patescibacteria group bacterium]|nr:hypothetical protein [Patescibacteria group bacterium]MBU1951713.1 hypothetical protein [Patescibacteria group bacterium]MBU2229082.1 hypothetical protein [Patescibacteria group bacterium]MBU2235910.1 hypothetical protein [Patescibacteria group bacterium]
MKLEEEKEIGQISHYYGKVGVGIIELTDTLKQGDTIHIKGNSTDFEQNISSMEVEHESVEKAGKGDSVGIKVDQKVKEGDLVFFATK